MSESNQSARVDDGQQLTSLLPCPLCHSTDLQKGACFIDVYPFTSSHQPAVRCVNCGCRATLKAWNTRPVPAPVGLEDQVFKTAEVLECADVAFDMAYRSFLASQLRAALSSTDGRSSAGQSFSVPDGYALVPIKPTKEMVEAGCDNNPTQWTEGTDRGFPSDVANDVYVSMVRAAPAPRIPVGSAD